MGPIKAKLIPNGVQREAPRRVRRRIQADVDAAGEFERLLVVNLDDLAELTVVDRQDIADEGHVVGILTLDDLIGLESQVGRLGDGLIQLTVVDVLLGLHVAEREEAILLFLAWRERGVAEDESVGRVSDGNERDAKRRQLFGLAATGHVILEGGIPDDVNGGEKVVVPVVVILFWAEPILYVVVKRSSLRRRVSFALRQGSLQLGNLGLLEIFARDRRSDEAWADDRDRPDGEQEGAEGDEDRRGRQSSSNISGSGG
jgi:hypothetical protein